MRIKVTLNEIHALKEHGFSVECLIDDRYTDDWAIVSALALIGARETQTQWEAVKVMMVVDQDLP